MNFKHILTLSFCYNTRKRGANSPTYWASWNNRQEVWKNADSFCYWRFHDSRRRPDQEAGLSGCIKRQQQINRKIRSDHSSSLKWVHRSIPNLPLPIKNVYCTLSRHVTAVVISPLWYAHTASRICSRTNRASSPPLPPWEKSSHF